MFKIYVIKESINDATAFYIDIIEAAILKSGAKFERINDINGISNEDIVVTFGNRMFYRARKRNPKYQINWFQGVSPEELRFSRMNYLKRFAYYLGQTFFENYALKHGNLSLFVSNKMKEHYSKKYNFNGQSFIMPCFNTELNMDAFIDKYKKPTFVYTGNMAGWQCFDETAELFSLVKSNCPEAELTIYTKDSEDAKRILEKYGVKAIIKYVPYSQLSDELKNYKYGFLLRDDDIVNNVATPTKMNSYLANGIIPIYSNVIYAFRENLSNLKYSIPVTDKNQAIESILSFEKQVIEARDVLKDYQQVFNEYYSRDYYIEKLSKLFKNIK